MAERQRFPSIWQRTVTPSGHKHDRFNQLWWWPSLDLAYVENQKAASRTILHHVRGVAAAYPRRILLSYRGWRLADSSPKRPPDYHLTNDSAYGLTDGALHGILANITIFTFVRDPVDAYGHG